MKLISRNIALQDQYFASFISSWQNIGNPAEDDYMTEEGEYFDEFINDIRFYSQSELDNLRNKEIIEFQKIIDNIPVIDSKLAGNIVVDTPDNSDEIDYLTNSLANLLELYRLEFIFIPLYKVSWFDDENIKHHHQATQLAYNKLKKIIKINGYDGGIKISTSSNLKKFLPPYFSLVQSNFYSYNFFYSEEMKVVLSFHYSGQIWFYCYTKDGLEKIKDFTEEYNLIINQEYTTYNTV